VLGSDIRSNENSLAVLPFGLNIRFAAVPAKTENKFPNLSETCSTVLDEVEDR
jgi:hypothetical protein